MPCITPEPTPPERKKLVFQEFGIQGSDWEVKSKLMSFACEALFLLENRDSQLLSKLSKPCQEWWVLHKKRDRERLRLKALSKLTPAEIEAL